MTLPELIHYLRDYPALLSIVLSTITDAEYEQYVDSLSDVREKVPATPARGTHTPEEALTALRDAMTPARGTHTPEEALTALRDAIEVNASVIQVICRDDGDRRHLLNTWSSIVRIKEIAVASPELAEKWHLHLVANLYLAPKPGQAPEGDDADWSSSAKLKCEQLIRQKLEVTTTEDLGDNLFSVVFSGPWRNTLVFSAAALKGDKDGVERDFMLYHMFAHLLMPGHLPYRSFGVRLEYKRGHTPPDLLTAQDGRYVQIEESADEAATCTLFNEYAAHDHLSSLSREVVRGVLKGGWANVPLIREIIRERQRSRGSLININIFGAIRGKDITGPLPYHSTLRVVKAGDRHIYVIGRDEKGGLWKRWICGPRVLTRLGLTTGDVGSISQKDLDGYQDGRPLIDPNDVDQVRQKLEESLIDGREKCLVSLTS